MSEEKDDVELLMRALRRRPSLISMLLIEVALAGVLMWVMLPAGALMIIMLVFYIKILIRNEKKRITRYF